MLRCETNFVANLHVTKLPLHNATVVCYHHCTLHVQMSQRVLTHVKGRGCFHFHDYHSMTWYMLHGACLIEVSLAFSLNRSQISTFKYSTQVALQSFRNSFATVTACKRHHDPITMQGLGVA